MSRLRSQLRKIMPRLSSEANKLRDEEARSRWMRMRQITVHRRTTLHFQFENSIID
jgi:hypothetical protein